MNVHVCYIDLYSLLPWLCSKTNQWLGAGLRYLESHGLQVTMRAFEASVALAFGQCTNIWLPAPNTPKTRSSI